LTTVNIQQPVHIDFSYLINIGDSTKKVTVHEQGSSSKQLPGGKSYVSSRVENPMSPAAQEMPAWVHEYQRRLEEV